MGKIKDIEIDGIEIKIYKRLPYRSECVLEEFLMGMFDGMEGKLSDFEDFDPKEIELSDLKGFDISKKIEVNDYLLTTSVMQPKLTVADLDDPDHEINHLFKELGDLLFNRYMGQYNEKALVKKKPTISPD